MNLEDPRQCELPDAPSCTFPQPGQVDAASLETFRTWLEQKSTSSRDQVCEELQHRAERAPVLQGEGDALLVAVPVILSYARKTRLSGQQVLAAGSLPSPMSEALQSLWSELLPGRRVAPLLTTLRLDRAFAAQPSDVQACINAGAELLYKASAGRHCWTVGEDLPQDVMPPIPAVELVMAAVECRRDTQGTILPAIRVPVLRKLAEVLGALFSTAHEVPGVSAGAPLPFYLAGERALSGQIRRIAALAQWQVDVQSVNGGDSARIVLSSASRSVDDPNGPICSWDSDWRWRTKASLARAASLADPHGSVDSYWVSRAGYLVGEVRH